MSIRAVKGIVDEGETAVFEVSASHAVNSGYPVKIKLSQSGDFINGPMERTVNLQAEFSETEFAVATDNDELTEPDGRITATIQAGSEYLVATQNTAHVIVSDAFDRQHRQTRVSTALHSVLPALLAHSTARTFDIASNRIKQGFSGSPSTSIELNGKSPALTALQSSGEMLNGSRTDWRSIIDDSSFTLALYPEGGEKNLATVWGVGDVWSLSGDGIGGQQSWDGETDTGHFGFDAGVGLGMMAGLAVSVSQSDINYGQYGGSGMSFGTLTTGFHPYLGITAKDGNSQMQLVAGYGETELELKQEGYLPETLRVHYNTVAIGGSKSIYSVGSFGKLHNFDLTGETWMARQYLESTGTYFNGATIETSYYRISADGSQEFDLNDWGTIRPTMSVGLRVDGKNQLASAGLELVNELEFSAPVGIDAAGKSSVLIADDRRVRRWGLTSSINYRQNHNDLGVNLELSPAWTRVYDGENVVLLDHAIVDGNNATSHITTNSAKIRSKLGYGIGIWDHSGVLTPYGGLTFADDGQNDLHIGSSYRFGSDIEFELVGTRNINSKNETAHQISFDAKVKW